MALMVMMGGWCTRWMVEKAWMGWEFDINEWLEWVEWGGGL